MILGTDMETRELKSWEEFENIITEVNKETEKLRSKKVSRVCYPIFRGVTDSEYCLASTLERIIPGMAVSKYHTIVKIVHKHVATCIGKTWDLDTKVDLCDFEFPAYEFMAYLRQNGFPSPLLDWTRSPYIAAFFAFGNGLYSKVKYVSIYVYREDCGYGKEWVSQEPSIRTLGPTIKTYRTHYLQQSEYSICVKKQDNDFYFANHEDVKLAQEQDFLIKYNIPASERLKVLGKLNLMNITAYSLFGSETSLIETLAVREIFLKYNC